MRLLLLYLAENPFLHILRRTVRISLEDFISGNYLNDCCHVPTRSDGNPDEGYLDTHDGTILLLGFNPVELSSRLPRDKLNHDVYGRLITDGGYAEHPLDVDDPKSSDFHKELRQFHA